MGRLIKRATVAALLLLGIGASPAHATGDILCEGEDVSVDMLVGRFEFISILRTVVRIGEETWSTDQNYAPGTPLGIAQAFEDDRMMLIDFTNDNFEGIIGRLRVVNLDDVSAGAFAWDGKGSWIVDCSLRG